METLEVLVNITTDRGLQNHFAPTVNQKPAVPTPSVLVANCDLDLDNNHQTPDRHYGNGEWSVHAYVHDVSIHHSNEQLGVSVTTMNCHPSNLS